MTKHIDQKIAQPLYDLIAILEDAKRGYLNAAEKIRDEVLSLLFERFGYQRGRYSNELRQVASRLGVGPAIDPYTLTLLHRTWMDLKNSFKFGQRDAVIHACIRGEETAIRNYSIAIDQLQDNEEVRSLLTQQVNGIKTVLNTIKEYTANTLK